VLTQPPGNRIQGWIAAHVGNRNSDIHRLEKNRALIGGHRREDNARPMHPPLQLLSHDIITRRHRHIRERDAVRPHQSPAHRTWRNPETLHLQQCRQRILHDLMNDDLFPRLIRYLDHSPSHCGIHDTDPTDNDSETIHVKPFLAESPFRVRLEYSRLPTS